MLLNNVFYIEILAKERKWIEQIHKGLMNSIYCKYELRPFYVEKKEQLLQADKTKMVDLYIEIIDNIINKIDEFITAYQTGRSININSLESLMFTNQLNYSETNKNSIELEKAKTAKETILDKINNYVPKENDKEFEEENYYIK